VDLTKLFSDCCPSVLAFINRLSVGSRPHFPEIIATGFFVDTCGLVATNRHVIDVFSQLRRDPRSGETSLAALGFFPSDDGIGWQMLTFRVVDSYALSQFSSSDKWYGKEVPDIGFVQLAVQAVPTLRLATERFYVKAGMEIATIGYPLGNAPLQVLGKLNQASPLIRHGIVSSLFPCPTALPHGFTIDIMQQGGSSGSPIFRSSDGVVVGMMSSGFPNTNVSIVEPAHIIQKALDEFNSSLSIKLDKLPTLSDLRARYPKPNQDTEMEWDTWIEPKPSA
jgi:hypothetical protein